jgi:hypothetical protein
LKFFRKVGWVFVVVIPGVVKIASSDQFGNVSKGQTSGKSDSGWSCMELKGRKTAADQKRAGPMLLGIKAVEREICW